MIALYSCNGYQLIRVVSYEDRDRLPELCLAEELNANDGKAVFASQDGRTIAWADGFVSDQAGAPPYDAATATGMYDP